MKLQKYGITLERLEKADIEMVRIYRNSAEIKKNMQYREYISYDMQCKWFKTINNEFNFYFIINYEEKKIGLINIKNFDWNSKLFESGLFIWDCKYIDSPAPLLASIMFSEFVYGFLKGVKSKIKIVQTNTKAISFNKNIGYIEIKSNNDGFNEYIQTKESFIASTLGLRKKALSFCNNDSAFYFYVEPQDKESGLAQKIYEHTNLKHQNLKVRKEGDTDIYSFLFIF